MATSIGYIKKSLPSYTVGLWYPKKEKLIKSWILLVTGDYQGLFEVYGHCCQASVPKGIMDQLWSELISACPSLDDFWNLVTEVDKKHEKSLILKGISLCQTKSEIDNIDCCHFKKDEEVCREIEAKKRELSSAD